MPMTQEEREAIVNELVTNECCWTEDDREVLMNLSDGSLLREKKRIDAESNAALVANAAKKGFEDALGNRHAFNPAKNRWETQLNNNQLPPDEDEEDMEEDMEEDEEDEDVRDKKPAKKAPPVPPAVKNQRPMTEKEWFDTAPAFVKSAVRNAMAIEAKEKQGLIDQLVANIKDEDKRTAVENRLKGKSLEELRDLQALAPTTNKANDDEEPTVNYFGASTLAGPIKNSKADAENYLPLPELSFNEAK